jgi:hypothetical protein
MIVDNVLIKVDFFDGGNMDMFRDGIDLFCNEG